MTIKEMEQILDIPRATIRFYEKEGLINPQREANGYRDYSEEDVERLKKVIIFRKIGLTVSDIEDIFDGVKSIDEVLDENMNRLQIQISELTGALNLCRKMKDDTITIESFDTTGYWNYVEEEEKQGHPFVDIAKDFVKEEKKVFLSYLGWTDSEGNLYSPKRDILNTVVILLVVGCIFCLLKKEWNAENLLKGFAGILYMLGLECILSIPVFFLGKKFPWVAKNRRKVLILAGVLLLIILFVLILIGKE
ncbi:MAG: MerR family transcriptional regulator [Lachnospiraceae bacterium]